uniref:Nonstructural protein n=1 Tax=Ara ararauna Chaphamaparvovirus TaxID=2794484 RepID=A0A8A4XED3_9VIRU|nr:MAG: nonstructural protein [Ara ararauna Chaphamaparvovirus]
MQREMERTRPDYGICLWVGSTGTSRDLNTDQAQALLITKDENNWEASDEPTLQRQLALLDMKQFQCCILQINDANGEPIPNPMIYALLLNDLTTVNSWVCTGEYSPQHIFHVHAMVQTSARTDSLRRSMNTAIINLTVSDNFRTQFGQQITLECLKLERCHKPSSMLAYLMKEPLWVCANTERYLQHTFDIDYHGLNDRFKPKPEEYQAPEMNAMTQEIVDAIVAGGCKTFEDVVRTSPSVISKYLHRPGIQNIVTNCLIYVRATGGQWSLELYKNADINPGPIHRVLLHQGIPPAEFDPIFHRWINKLDSKRNCICFFGPSNTGKSAFISGLKQCVPWGEIVNSNSFAFEGLVEACIGVWEEPLCSPELAEKAKQVLEGMTTSIPIKYKRPYKLPKTPIIITTNHPLWRFCTQEEPMFRNRMWIFQFNFAVKDEPYTCRTREHSCECGHCTASRGGAPPDGESESSSLQGTEQSIPTGSESIRSPEESDVGTGSMCGGGTGISRSDNSAYGSSSSSANEQRSDSTRSVVGSSSSIIRFLGHSEHQSGNSGNRICSPESGTTGRLEPDNSSGNLRHDSRGDGSNRGGKQSEKRHHRGDGTNRGEHEILPELVGMGTSKTHQGKIPVQPKKRKLDRKLATITNPYNIPLYVPSKQDWETYLSYLYHWYG